MNKIIFSLIFTSITFSAFALDNNPVPVPVGKVVWTKGILKALMENKEERSLQKDSFIYLKDVLLTDNTSTAEIVFTDKSLMTFKPNTKFIISSYQFNEKKSSSNKYSMNLVEGGFRTITGLIAKKNPSEYKINTPVATIGVRGTDFSAYIRNGEFLIAYSSGSPCITSAKKTLCLNKTTPFAKATLDKEPIPLNEMPAIFSEQIPITPAEIKPFTTETRSSNSNGTATSFCISQ